MKKKIRAELIDNAISASTAATLAQVTQEGFARDLHGRGVNPKRVLDPVFKANRAILTKIAADMVEMHGEGALELLISVLQCHIARSAFKGGVEAAERICEEIESQDSDHPEVA